MSIIVVEGHSVVKRFAARAAEPTQSDSVDEAQLLLWPDSPERSKRTGEPRNAYIGQLPPRVAIGDVVAVFALGSQGPSIEGTGVIVSPAAAENEYHIRFAGERVAKHRFVPAEWQADPERSLALLTEFWRSWRRDNPRIEDFFPDGSS